MNATIASTFTSANTTKATAVTFSLDRFSVFICPSLPDPNGRSAPGTRTAAGC